MKPKSGFLRFVSGLLAGAMILNVPLPEMSQRSLKTSAEEDENTNVSVTAENSVGELLLDEAQTTETPEGNFPETTDFKLYDATVSESTA